MFEGGMKRTWSDERINWMILENNISYHEHVCGHELPTATRETDRSHPTYLSRLESLEVLSVISLSRQPKNASYLCCRKKAKLVNLSYPNDP